MPPPSSILLGFERFKMHSNAFGRNLSSSGCQVEENMCVGIAASITSDGVHASLHQTILVFVGVRLHAQDFVKWIQIIGPCETGILHILRNWTWWFDHFLIMIEPSRSLLDFRDHVCDKSSLFELFSRSFVARQVQEFRLLGFEGCQNDSHFLRDGG